MFRSQPSQSLFFVSPLPPSNRLSTALSRADESSLPNSGPAEIATENANNSVVHAFSSTTGDNEKDVLPEPFPAKMDVAEEIELWKAAHQAVVRRLVEVTDRYNDMEVKYEELSATYHALKHQVNNVEDDGETVNAPRKQFIAENGDADVRQIEKRALDSVTIPRSCERKASSFETECIDSYGFVAPPAVDIHRPSRYSITDSDDRTIVSPMHRDSMFSASNPFRVVKKNNTSFTSVALIDELHTTTQRVDFEKLFSSRPSMPTDQFRMQLKRLLRHGAPSYELRALAWQYCVDSHLRAGRCQMYTLARDHQQEYYQTLLLDRSHASVMSHDGSLQIGAARQIGLDLLRTFPNNVLFKTISSPMVRNLEYVLTAFSRHNPKIGYTQGMNRLAGIALLCLPDEEDAFWALVTVAEYLLPGYYGDTMSELLVDQRVLGELVSEKMPRLAAHFGMHHIDVSLFSFNWFLVVFVDSTLPCVFMPLWDAFLFEGKKVLFRYALAMLKFWERELLAINSCSELNDFLRSMGERIDTPSAAARLRRIAFEEMNPLPARLIQRKRRAHCLIIEKELGRIQRMRHETRCANNAAVEAEILFHEKSESVSLDFSVSDPTRCLSMRPTTDLDSASSSSYYVAIQDHVDDTDSFHSLPSYASAPVLNKHVTNETLHAIQLPPIRWAISVTNFDSELSIKADRYRPCRAESMPFLMHDYNKVNKVVMENADVAATRHAVSSPALAGAPDSPTSSFAPVPPPRKVRQQNNQRSGLTQPLERLMQRAASVRSSLRKYTRPKSSSKNSTSAHRSSIDGSASRINIFPSNEYCYRSTTDQLQLYTHAFGEHGLSSFYYNPLVCKCVCCAVDRSLVSADNTLWACDDVLRKPGGAAVTPLQFGSSTFFQHALPDDNKEICSMADEKFENDADGMLNLPSSSHSTIMRRSSGPAEVSTNAVFGQTSCEVGTNNEFCGVACNLASTAATAVADRNINERLVWKTHAQETSRKYKRRNSERLKNHADVSRFVIKMPQNALPFADSSTD